MKAVRTMAALSLVFISSASFSANLDEAMIKSIQAQIIQMQTMWSQVPNQISTMSNSIQELLDNCSQQQNNKATSYCLNASSYYSDYVQAVNQNASKEVIDKAYNNYLGATQQALSIMNRVGN